MSFLYKGVDLQGYHFNAQVTEIDKSFWVCEWMNMWNGTHYVFNNIGG